MMFLGHSILWQSSEGIMYIFTHYDIIWLLFFNECSSTFIYKSHLAYIFAIIV